MLVSWLRCPLRGGSSTQVACCMVWKSCCWLIYVNMIKLAMRFINRGSVFSRAVRVAAKWDAKCSWRTVKMGLTWRLSLLFCIIIVPKEHSPTDAAVVYNDVLSYQEGTRPNVVLRGVIRFRIGSRQHNVASR